MTSTYIAYLYKLSGTAGVSAQILWQMIVPEESEVKEIV